MATSIACLRARKHAGGHGKKLAKFLNAYIVTSGYRPAERLMHNCVVVNYGVGTVPIWHREDILWINHPNGVRNSADKRRSFECFDKHGVPCLEWTPAITVAEKWRIEGSTVYARTILTGSKGKGIVISKPDGMPVDFAPLYTKAFPTKHEFRVFTAGGKAVDVVQKKRMGEKKRKEHKLAEVDEARRNYDRGWVFAHKDLDLTYDQRAAIEMLGIEATDAVGLDYGAADILMDKHGHMVVCEMNSAPALDSGTTWDAFKNYFRSIRDEANP